MNSRAINFAAPLLALVASALATSHVEVARTKSLPGLAQFNPAILSALTTSLEPVTGDSVQAEINAAIQAGESSYTLPATTINLDKSLAIKPGTRNFTLQGQPLTRLVRASSAQFPLIRVGVGYVYSYENSAFSALPQTTIASVAAGLATLTSISGSTVVPGGWYAIIGTDPVNDIVRHKDGQPTFYNKRELVRVMSVSGNQITIDRPLGRAFASAELRQIQIPGRESYYDQMVENITVKDLTFDGRSSVDGLSASKLFAVNCFSGFTLDNIKTTNFNLAGISIGFGNGAVIKNSLIGNADTYEAGYGIEFLASRFVTVNNCRFRNHRWGVIFQMGTQDALVQDCTYDESLNGGFDTGHGQGEQRITYRRCLAPTFSIANPSWRRGVEGVTLENCSATSQINIYGNANNVKITGKYPTSSMTAPIICFFSEGGGTGIPSGNTYPQKVTLENGNCIRSIEDGVNMRTSSISGIIPAVADLTVNNWSFTNTITDRGNNVQFRGVGANTSAKFDGCSFNTGYRWGSNITVGDSANNSAINLSIKNCSFVIPGPAGVKFSAASRGTLVQESNLFNQTAMTTASFDGLTAFLNSMNSGG